MVKQIKTKVFLKIFSIFLFVLLFGAYASTFALFDGNPYAPGSTLDPECAPTDINCKVLLTSGGSSPWFTGTSNIYHNGNVNVGSDTASINTSIGGGLFSNVYNPIASIYGQSSSILPSGSFDMFSSVAINNDGNPVIAFYVARSSEELPERGVALIPKAYASGTSSSLNIMVCSDPNCNDGVINLIDGGFTTRSDFRPIVKVGTDNKPRIAYEIESEYGTSVGVRYVVCTDTLCSSLEDGHSSSYDALVDIGYSNGGKSPQFSFSLDGNNNPYILYNSDDGINDSVSLARYTGTGTESSCIWMGEIIAGNWKCSQIPLPTSATNGYYLDSGIGDFMTISEDGKPRFITEYYNSSNSSGNTYITYNECNDIDCTDVSSTIIDLIASGGYGTDTSLAVNSDGIPYVLYGFYDSGDSYRSDLKIAYLDSGIGSGCSESSNWSCNTIGSLDISKGDDYYWYSDMKIGNDNIPQISINKGIYDNNNDNYLYSIDYIKCSNNSCSDTTTSTIFNISEADMGSNYQVGASLAISPDGSTYLSYLDSNESLLLFAKISQSGDVSFNSSNNNSLYTGGDLGISGNLFVDGSIVTPNGIYLNNGTPDNTSNALYNVDGDLYWNGSVIGGGSVSVGPDLVLGEAGVISGSLTINTSYGGPFGSSGYGISLLNYYDYCSSNDILCPQPYKGNFPLYLPAESGVLATQDYVLNNSSSPITIINSSNLFSTGLEGTAGTSSGDNSTSSITNSIFLGGYAGYNRVGTSNNNFLGYQAGYSQVYYGDGEGDNNFLGYRAGFTSTSFSTVSDSNFLGNSAGYDANRVYSSNFFGTNAGYGATNASNSNFLGQGAGYNAVTASNSNFFGYNSGYGIDGINETGFNSNFLGSEAGYQASSAFGSNFLGSRAGIDATNASGSNFFGNSAGDSASSASNSNFFGTASGSGATNASYSNFFGFNAGNSASSASHSNFLGRDAGYLATNASYSNFFGYNAGQSASSASNSNFLGAVAGQSATNASNSNFLGVNAGQSATNASNSNFFGTNAGSHSPNAANSIFIGRDSGINSSINNTDTYNDLTTFANTSILIGHKTSTGNYSNSIAIGAYATNTATNQFMIGSTTRPINTTRFQGATTECTISTGTGIACTSDERLKTITSDLNIDPITKEEISVLDKLIKVKTVNFKWNDNPEGKNNIGFLAQDLYSYFPELINGDPENKEEYLSVYYSNMTPILVEAIREMNLKVGNLDTEIKKITINDLMSDFFGGAVDQVVEGVAYLKDIVVGTLKVGSPEKRTGITLYDEETGDTYCLSISNGETKTTEGDCPVIKVPDACLNLEEYQSEIPSGYVLDENNDCVEEIKEVNNSLPLMPAGEVKPFSTETPASI